MGIQERQERERAAVRRAILDAARELFVKEGFANVTVRRIAKQIEYSPSAIYGYFEQKDDICLELAEEGYRLLLKGPNTSVSSDPVDTLRAHYGRIYEFSCQHPEYFALMFLERSLPTVRNQERFAFVMDFHHEGPRLVQACVDAGSMPASVQGDAAAGVLWAAIHGPAVIRVTWPLAGEFADVLAASVLRKKCMKFCCNYTR